MTSQVTFYLSRVVGSRVYTAQGEFIGKVKDLFINSDYRTQPSGRPMVSGILITKKKKEYFYDFSLFSVSRIEGKPTITPRELVLLDESEKDNGLFLADIVLDKQIVDLNGRKLVRVNDIRFVQLGDVTFAIAVDVGIEGLLRRIGIAKEMKSIVTFFGGTLPAKFFHWADVETINPSNFHIQLSKSQSKLNSLHPSDLADIIEDLGRKMSAEVFSALDEETAADVLEELEPETQKLILDSLSIQKAADVLELMPADEVADILNSMSDERAEQLLNEMEHESQLEVRELLEYEENVVGSIMTTEYLSFNRDKTMAEVLAELREIKPEAEELYSLFVTDEHEVLIASFSLRDIVVSDLNQTVANVMTPTVTYLYDDDELDEIAEQVSKYNLLAIPVVNRDFQLQGMVVIDDVIEDLMNKGRTNK